MERGSFKVLFTIRNAAVTLPDASGNDSIKMASTQQKAFCVLEFAKTKSVITGLWPILF